MGGRERDTTKRQHSENNQHIREREVVSVERSQNHDCWNETRHRYIGIYFLLLIGLIGAHSY
jgi:hypothetical protein